MNDDKIIPGFNDAESIVAMHKRHLSIAMRMQKLALAALSEWEQKLEAGQPLNLTSEDAKTLLAAGSELERSALRGKESGDAPIPKAKKPN